MKYCCASVVLSYELLLSIFSEEYTQVPEQGLVPAWKTPETLKHWMLRYLSFGCAAHCQRQQWGRIPGWDIVQISSTMGEQRNSAEDIRILLLCRNDRKAPGFAYAGLWPGPPIIAFFTLLFLAGLCVVTQGRENEDQSKCSIT